MAVEKTVANRGYLNNRIIRRVQGSVVFYEILDENSNPIFRIQVEDTSIAADPLDIAIILYDMIAHPGDGSKYSTSVEQSAFTLVKRLMMDVVEDNLAEVRLNVTEKKLEE